MAVKVHLRSAPAANPHKAASFCFNDNGVGVLGGNVRGPVEELSPLVDALLRSSAQLSGAEAHRLSACLRVVCEGLEIQRERGSKEEDRRSYWNSISVVRLIECGLPVKLLACLRCLAFEDRKIAAQVLSDFLEDAGGDGGHVARYVQSTPQLMQNLLEGCAQQEVFFLTSQIACDAIRCPQVVSAFLECDFMLRILDLCSHQNFEISNEAFALLRELLLGQQHLVADHMEANYEEFFSLYHQLLQREKDYVVQRQALKLLGELLLNGAFQGVMLRYVNDENFLQIHMMLLADRSQTIPLDAFHIFKLFVANPKKPRAVEVILCRNVRRLSKLLDSFRHRQDDDAFEQDLNAVLHELDRISG